MATMIYLWATALLRGCLRPLALVDDLIVHTATDFAHVLRFVLRKAASTVKGLVLLPGVLFWAMIETISFALIICAPAFVLSRTLYRKDAHLIRTVAYGAHHNQRMDIYLPSENLTSDSQLPVLVFVQGGGWTICMREFYSALGHSFRKQGFITVIPSYRTFPQAKPNEILDDVQKCIKYTIANIKELGGNPNRIHLMGQSAGAHLIAQAVMKELEKHHSDMDAKDQMPGPIRPRTKRSMSSPSAPFSAKSQWAYSGIKSVILISGVYDILRLDQNLCAQGKEHLSGIKDLFDGRENYADNSPDHVLKRMIDARKTVLGLEMPSFIFIHGTKDKTCLFDAAVDFHNRLRSAHFPTQLIPYEGESHMESIMEVLEGNDDSRLVSDVIRLIGSEGEAAKHPHDHRTDVEAKVSKLVAFAEMEMMRASQLWRVKSYVMRFLSPV